MRRTPPRIWIVVGVVVVALAALVIAVSGKHGSPPTPSVPVLPNLAQYATRADCPADPTPTDRLVPPPQDGVVPSSTGGGDGPLGAGIVGDGIRNPYYEIGAPTVPGHADHPVGLMLVIHGGGWVSRGPNTTEDVRPEADFWRSLDWETINVDYRGCWQSLPDIVDFYARLRSLFPHRVICATGQSSGGTLALLLAALVGRKLACVISESGITNLATLGTSTAYPSTIPGDSPAGLSADILHAFGVTTAAPLAAFSPSNYVASFTTPVLLGSAVNDAVIPLSQAAGFQEAVLASHPGTYVQVDQLPCPTQPDAVACRQSPLVDGTGPNAVPFVHGTTSAAGLGAFHQEEQRLMALALTAGTG